MTNSRRQTLRSILLAATILTGPLIVMTPSMALAQVALGISVQIAPPELPVYEQPPMPDVGYIWTPGYWAWADPVGYYWVPGTWVQPPTVGVLWTPPYWGWSGGAYVFNAGYWGPHVGFYGGVDYGFGYGGRGYEGGRWDNGGFVYNRNANNFGSVHVTNVYTSNLTVINNTHVSYVGGTGGIHAEPTTDERLAAHETHAPPTGEQTKHIEAAKSNPDFALSHNNGHPAIAATSRPAQFTGAGVTHAQPAAAQAGAKEAAKPAAAQADVKPPMHPAAAQAGMKEPAKPAAAQADVKPPMHPAAAQAGMKEPAKPAAAQAAVKPPTHPAAAQAGMKEPAKSAAAQAAVKPPTHPAAAQPAVKLPAHPAAMQAAAKQPPHPAAESATQKQPAHPQAQAAPKVAHAPAAEENKDKEKN